MEALSEAVHDRLQRFMDGELDDAEHARFAEEVAADAQLSQALEKLRAVRGLMQDDVAPHVAALDAEALFRRIDGELRTEVSSRPAAAVPTGGKVVQLRAWRVAAPVLAVAAIFGLVWLRQGDETVPVATVDDEGQAPAAKAAAESEGRPQVLEETSGALAALSLRTDVIKVDFGGHSGTVFTSGEGSEAEVTVVWVNEL